MNQYSDIGISLILGIRPAKTINIEPGPVGALPQFDQFLDISKNCEGVVAPPPGYFRLFLRAMLTACVFLVQTYLYC